MIRYVHTAEATKMPEHVCLLNISVPKHAVILARRVRSSPRPSQNLSWH
jgi:hypothetical protein